MTKQIKFKEESGDKSPQNHGDIEILTGEGSQDRKTVRDRSRESPRLDQEDGEGCIEVL